MPHRFPCNTPHGCNSNPPPASSSSISSPMTSSPADSAGPASSTSANSDPSQHSAHRVQSVSVGLGFMRGTMADRPGLGKCRRSAGNSLNYRCGRARASARFIVGHSKPLEFIRHCSVRTLKRRERCAPGPIWKSVLFQVVSQRGCRSDEVQRTNFSLSSSNEERAGVRSRKHF